MAYWLFKTEPGDYSWDQFLEDGRTAWDGVRNHQAAANMRRMKTGDQAFFYRSIKDPAVIGIMQVVREAYDDPAGTERSYTLVDVEPVRPLVEPVSLKAIKAEPKLADLALVRQSRLSVMPVSEAHWAQICAMAGGSEP